MISLQVGGRTHILSLPGTLPPREMGHPLHYVVSHPEIVHGYLNMIYDMIKDLPKGQEVIDLMGGIGIYPKVFWDLLEPKSWTSVEIDIECKHFFQEPRARFFWGNAYNYPLEGADIVFMDMHNGTLRTISDDRDGRRQMWRNIANSRPKHVVVTDYGYYWVHLPNHHPWYEKTFGCKPTKENYATLWDRWMRDNIGYTVAKEAHGFQSQYFIMEPV
jgi:hypothetical protein